MIIDRLVERVAGFGPVCVGLDTSPAIVPGGMIDRWGIPEAMLRFNREIIAATADVVACFKVQIAHYEAQGIDGMACYRDTLAEIRRTGVPVIGDVKRGDIASTAAMYAKAHFAGDFEVDLITVNPYMGLDAIAPYLDDVRHREKGLFVLVRTSNPSSSELQELAVSPTATGSLGSDMQVYEAMAANVAHWGEPFRGESGYSSIGAVVGATHPEQLARLRRMYPKLFFLVPGYGAQGGGGQDVAPAFVDGNGAVVNASRSILGAYRGANKECAEDRFAESAREACLAMRDDIRRWMP